MNQSIPLDWVRMVSILSSGPIIPGIPKGKTVVVAEVNQPHCSEESRQQLENVDHTRLLVVASGKLIMQKKYSSSIGGRDMSTTVKVLGQASNEKTTITCHQFFQCYVIFFLQSMTLQE